MGGNLHSRRAKLVQVQARLGRGKLRPLLSFGLARLFLALLDDRKACHDSRDGNQSDSQGANKRLPSGGFVARRPVRPAAGPAVSVPNERSLRIETRKRLHS